MEIPISNKTFSIFRMYYGSEYLKCKHLLEVYIRDRRAVIHMYI